MANSKDGKGHKDKYMYIDTSVVIWNTQWYRKALALTVQKLLARLKFSKRWVQLQGQGVKNNGTNGKVLSQRILNHVKYQGANTHCSKVISKVKVSERRADWQNNRGQKQYPPPPISDLGGIKI